MDKYFKFLILEWKWIINKACKSLKKNLPDMQNLKKKK